MENTTIDEPTTTSETKRERFVHQYGQSKSAQSISRRFSYALIGVVTLFLIGSATIAIILNIARIDDELQARLDNALKLSQISLPTPLWNLDNDVVDDFVGALFLDEAVVYAKVLWGDQVITERKSQGFEFKDLESARRPTLFEGTEFIVKSADIHFEGSRVGHILIVMSRKSVNRQILWQIYGIIALTIGIIVAILLTSILITRRYISRPLLQLQNSASLIADGDLDTFIDKSSRDEVGMLAQHLDAMRESIKRLFGELGESKDKLEDYSRTLEQKVEKRTLQLARSVEELKALGEVSQAVSSTLDPETVLASIARHAVQLSKADAGTIYEFDEAAQGFIPRTNYGLSAEIIDALRKSQQRVGDRSGIGRASAARTAIQIPDLLNEPEYPMPFMHKTGFRALLCVPLLREDRIIGGLVVRRKAAGEFPASVVDLLQTFAAQSALAMDNARLFQEIQDKSRELEIASQHKSQFLANMSHELRTPLNAIIGFSEVLLEKMFGKLNDKQEEYLNDIFTSGKHLLNLINDILDLSKIEAGKMELEMSMFDLQELLDSSLIVVKERALAHGITLSLEMPDNIDIIADERKVKQIVLNLLSNAVKFTPDSGKVGIRTRRNNDVVEIAVWDSGIGITPDDQERIFEEFQQAGETLTAKPEGTGLGLALTKRLVELHGGRIWVESKQGHGSIFTFTLPTEGNEELKRRA